MNSNDLQRFWKKVEVKGSDECWVWLDKLNKYGLGCFHISVKVNGKTKWLTISAPRAAYIAVNGEIPPEERVIHTCKNDACVNPKHILCLTLKERGEYQSKNLLTAYGEISGTHKLTWSEVAEIRERYVLEPYDPASHFTMCGSKLTMQHLADEFNVTKQTIWRVIHNLSWFNTPDKIEAQDGK